MFQRFIAIICIMGLLSTAIQSTKENISVSCGSSSTKLITIKCRLVQPVLNVQPFNLILKLGDHNGLSTTSITGIEISPIHKPNIYIKHFPVNIFTDYENLETIFLPHCNIEEFNINYTSNKKSKIRVLTLPFNCIKEIDYTTMEHFIELKEIDLSHNQLHFISRKLFSKNIRLKILILAGNLIKEIHQNAFENLINLTTINLSQNKIRTIPRKLFYNNKNISDLDLSGNLITDINKSIVINLHNLHTLSLENNKIKQFGFDLNIFFSNIYNLSELRLFGNNFNCNFLIKLVNEMELRKIQFGLWEVSSFDPNSTDMNYKGIDCIIARSAN